MTNDGRGEIIPCGCKTNPLGGLAKRGTVIRNVRANEQNVLLLEAGNFSKGEANDSVSNRETDLILSAMEAMGYDAICPGEKEIQLGENWWFQKQRSFSLPWVCANLMKDSRPFIDRPYIIKLLPNRLRVAVLGLIDPDLLSQITEIPRLSVKPIDETVKKYSSLLAKKADLIVLLASLTPQGHDNLHHLVNFVPLLAYGGSVMEHIPHGVLTDRLILMNTKGFGKYLGRADLEFDKRGAIISVTGQSIPLSVKLTDDLPIAEIFRQHQIPIERLVPIYNANN